MQTNLVNVIAIDGPVAAGKTTVAKNVAAQLRMNYMDTGAMYRAIGLALRSHNIDLKNEDELSLMLPTLKVQLEWLDGVQHVFVNEVDMTPQLRTPEADMAASDVATMPAVREFLVNIQQHVVSEHGIIVEGRDIGSVVFPNAIVKVYLDASASERANRRLKQNVGAGIAEDDFKTFTYTLQLLEARDKQDMSREISPLICTNSHTRIDTTGMDVEAVTSAIVELYTSRCKEQGWELPA